MILKMKMQEKLLLEIAEKELYNLNKNNKKKALCITIPTVIVSIIVAILGLQSPSELINILSTSGVFLVDGMILIPTALILDKKITQKSMEIEKIKNTIMERELEIYVKSLSKQEQKLLKYAIEEGSVNNDIKRAYDMYIELESNMQDYFKKNMSEIMKLKKDDLSSRSIIVHSNLKDALNQSFEEFQKDYEVTNGFQDNNCDISQDTALMEFAQEKPLVKRKRYKIKKRKIEKQ